MQKSSYFKHFSASQQYSLQGRLLLYFSLLIFIVFICVIMAFWAFDVVNMKQRSISKSLDDYLATYEKSVSQQFSNIAAYSLQMSASASKIMDKTLEKQGLSFNDLENNKEAVATILDNINATLQSSLYISKASGVYVVLDTTVNADLPHAQNSRSGLYFKIMNISSPNDANPMVFLFRGMPQIAAKNTFEFHNNWDLEFNITPYASIFAKLRATTDSLSQGSYTLTVPHQFASGWEKVILFGAPILGKNGQFYGACGFEISELLYNLLHTHIKPSLQEVTGLVATQKMDAQGGALVTMYTNFSHGNPYSFLAEPKKFTITHGEFYNIYSNETEEFVGKKVPIRIFPQDLLEENTQWNVVAMLPKNTVDKLIWSYYSHIALIIALCIAIAFGLSYYFARRYSSPIVAILAEIQKGNNTKTNILEFSSLIEYFKDKEQKLRSKLAAEEATLSRDKRELLNVDISAYNTFIAQLETLTKSERAVFELYTQGYSAQAVAKQLHVSINTIRTHNRNIYGKLYVSSYKELMVYIKMMVGNDNA